MIDIEEKIIIDSLMKSGALTEEELADGIDFQEKNGGTIIDALLEKDHIRKIDLDMLSRSRELDIPYNYNKSQRLFPSGNMPFV